MIVNTIYEPPKDEGPTKYKLRGIFAHYCYDWDGLAVSEFTPEFHACGEQWPGWRGILLPLAKYFNRMYWNLQERFDRRKENQ